MPLPKETPFKTCTQLRPISLTNIIMRLFERVVFRCELSNVINNSIGSDQFAYRKGLNTTCCLLCLLGHSEVTELLWQLAARFSLLSDRTAHVCTELAFNLVFFKSGMKQVEPFMVGSETTSWLFENLGGAGFGNTAEEKQEQ